MENSLKALLLAGAVLVTIVVITIGFFFLRQGQAISKMSSEKMDQLSAELRESDITMYDKERISGSEVRNVLQKFKGEYLAILVSTGRTQKGTFYNYEYTSVEKGKYVTMGKTQLDTDIADTSDKKSEFYINPNGKFLGTVFRDANGQIVAISFTQQN